MRHDFALERRAILFGVVALVVADIALAVYGWNLSSARRPQQDIRQKIPAIQRDCDQFEQSLFPASTGYSSVSAELGSIANKAGLQLESRSFLQSEVKGRDLEQVEIEAVVTGSYSGVVRFLNGLQRSNNVYAVEALQAKADETQQGGRGEVRVSMHIKTYFRTT
jgi:Tfp pilus assembly protein PilO